MLAIVDASDRRSERRAPRDLAQFTVELGDNVSGFLQNISEHGLCVVIPVDQPAMQAKQPVTGRVLGQGIRLEFPFEGKAVWFSLRKLEQVPYVFAGIEFNTRMEIPESLISLSLAREDLG
ncbi:MAG: PilZ domain-containing protein [Leptospiraceae bacterium]|nr:PilZ domain-containing protein [Leptospiraceae bacterium]MCB1302989.1 PilZ domain-containing protein [Leptospiraceae bacterium]